MADPCLMLDFSAALVCGICSSTPLDTIVALDLSSFPLDSVSADS